MPPARLLGVLAISSIPLWFSALSPAQAGDPAAIQQKLNAQFKLTRTTVDRSDIVTPGDVVVIHKPGLVMYDVASPLPPSNSYKNGRIGQGWGGFGKDLAIGMVSPESVTAADYAHRQFVVDEKCWVTSVQVQKDGILFQLVSDPINDIRYYANLKIPFADKKTVPSVDVATQLVTEVLTVDPGEDQGGQQATGPAAGAAPTSAQTGRPATPPAPAPLQPIVPPPPPANAPPPTIALGQTKEQVTAAFGQPTKAAKIGAKEIFYYKDMKVTFLNGKVSNVE